MQMEEDLTSWNKNGDVSFLPRTTFMGYFLAETKANCIQIIDFGYVGSIVWAFADVVLELSLIFEN